MTLRKRPRLLGSRIHVVLCVAGCGASSAGSPDAGCIGTCAAVAGGYQSLTTVLQNLNRTAISSITAGNADRLKNHDYLGFQWNAGDNATADWYPQGITGGSDVQADGRPQGRRLLLVSWHDHTGNMPAKGLRVSLADITGTGPGSANTCSPACPRSLEFASCSCYQPATMIRLVLMVAIMAMVALMGSVGCGGEDAADPRCVSLCTIQEPSVAGAYDICSASSASACEDLCMVRIADSATLCASCLLEEAEFEVEPSFGLGDFCQNNVCEATGREGTCTYPQGDDAARLECVRQVYPRRDVECQPDFRPVTECAAVCTTGA